MELICKYCEAIDIDDDRPVDLYLSKSPYAKDDQVYASCAKHARSKGEDSGEFSNDEKIFIPEGWELVPSDAFRDIKKGNEAFLKARNVMKNSVTTWHISSGYVYDLAAFYERIQNYFENQIKGHLVFREELGLHNRSAEDYVSGAYCPECRSPLLHVTELRSDKALSIAASKLVGIMGDTREKRNGTVYICLGCSVAYVEPPIKKGKK